MNAIAIIPARMAASRFPGKPLAKILGLPMSGHCYFRTKLAFGSDKVYIAKRDDRIRNYAQTIGAKAVDTAANHTRVAGRTAGNAGFGSKNSGLDRAAQPSSEQCRYLCVATTS